MTLHEKQLSIAEKALQRIGFSLCKMDTHEALQDRIDIAREAIDEMHALANQEADSNEENK